MAVSRDVIFLGEIKISVVSFGGGYAVRRSDMPEFVFLSSEGKPFEKREEAIDEASRICGKMQEEFYRYGRLVFYSPGRLMEDFRKSGQQ